jgi:serine/threonine protein kinase
LDNTWKPGRHDVSDKYIFFSPLSTSTFHSLIASKASAETRIELFAQIQEGVAFLHKNGIAHRDIKPANLTVLSYDPAIAQIIDFGSATTKMGMLYDTTGTITYLAPEQRKGSYHGFPVDYWACGLVAAEIIGYKRSSQKSMGQKDVDAIQGWLKDRPDCPMAVCSQAMLQVEPGMRMKARDALQFLARFRKGIVKAKHGRDADAQETTLKVSHSLTPLRDKSGNARLPKRLHISESQIRSVRGTNIFSQGC